MATPVIMPKFGMAQEEGTIIRWLKKEGDPVEKDEAIAEVQTDKVDMEVEAPASGILRDIRFGPDATVPVTTVIALIAAPGEQVAPTAPTPSALPAPKTEPQPESKPEAKATPVAQRVAAASGVDLARVTPSGSAGRITRADVEKALATTSAPAKPRATPAARRRARESGVEVGAVPGSGPAGRVQAVDVTAFLAAQAAAPEPVAPAQPEGAPAGEPLRGMRRTIAVRLAQAWQAIPHIFLTTTIDMTQAEALRARLAPDVERAGGKLTPTVLLARVGATALTRHPRLNAWLQGSGGDLTLTEHATVNLGIAVALADGLIVPVVAGAERLGVAALAVQVADLSARARAGELKPQEVMDGTFTISNLGVYPVEHFTAIINPPQVAILAVGRTAVQPVWDGTAFQPRPTLQVTLSADHRAVDGAVAAAFLAEVKVLLEEPGRLLL
jgi:pyruvate dehydrogenase E2 component (dihydrolipoamide acetyltransferase)